MMRHRIKMITIIIVIIMMYVFASYIDTHYTREATVIHTADNYCVVAIDNNGNEWEFCADSVCVGQTIDMKMYTNHTGTIYDDEVVDIKITAGVK